MTKAPRVNGVSERTSPVKSLHHHHHNGGDSSTVLENGFHEKTTKTNNSSIIRSKKDVNVNVTAAAGDDQPPAPLLLNGLDQSSPVSLNISGSSSSKSGNYLSPNQNRSPINSNAPLYKVIDKSMSYTKSPQLLSPGSAAASQQSRVQSPTTLNVNVATRSPNCQGSSSSNSSSITKTPAEEVKSNRRGTGQPLSPVSSPLKSPPLLSSSATTRGDPGKRSKQLRKTELSLLNDEAENFMFPKAKEEDLDSDSSDVIVIVKGKKKTKAKQTAEASVDDRTMALIKQEMGEEGEGEGDEEEEEEVFEDAREEADGQEQDKTSIAKAVNLLPLKKRFGASKAAKKATETLVASKNKKKLKAVPKKGGKLVKEEEEVEVEVPPVLPKETQKKKKKAAPKTKKGSQPVVMVVVKEEPKDEEEEEEEEVTLDQEEITKPVRRRKPKKETAKERRKREKLEKELNAMVKMEQDELEQHLSSDQLEEFSNLTLLMETEEMTRFQFAFERVPSLEPWYAPFHRQDEGQERIFEYYGSTSEYKK